MNSIREDLKAYLDGELSAARRIEIEQALADDKDLREELEFYRLLGRSIQASAKPIPVVKPAEPVLGKTIFGLPSRYFGFPQLALTVGCMVVLAFFLFPVYARAKYAAKDSAAMMESAKSLPTAAGAFAEERQQYSSTATKGAVPASPMMDGVQAKSAGKSFGGEAGGGFAGGAPAEGYKTTTRALSSSDANEAVVKPAVPTTSAPSIASNRQIIRTAGLSMRVSKVVEAARQVETIAQGNGGYISESSVTGDPETPYGMVVVRVNSRLFTKALGEIRRLGTVLSETSTGQDVTEQIVDTEARIKTLKAEAESLREILRQARRLTDILEVKDRITQVQSEIDSMGAVAKSLRSAANLATITVNLTQGTTVKPPPAAKSWLEDAWNEAVSGLFAIGRGLGAFLIFALVYSPIWVTVLLLAWWLVRRMAR